MRRSQLLEVQISVKRNDCAVSNSLSKAGLINNLINLNLGIEESSHLLEASNEHKYITSALKKEGVKVFPISRNKFLALSESCTPCSILAKYNVVVLSAKTPQSDSVIYRLLTDKKTLNDIIKEFLKHGVEHSILDETSYASLPGLTLRESEIVTYALLNGYFDVRRRVTLSAIADHFFIKPSTADLILRRALKKIVEAQVMRKI